MRFLLAAALLLSLALNGALSIWYIGITPVKRMLWEAHLQVMVHDARPVVLLGDSIMASLEAPDGVVNLAVSGATAPFTLAEVLPDALKLEPRRVVVGLGINDLRGGRAPEAVAADLIALGEQITQADASTDIVFLAVLPLARSTDYAGATDNAAIAALNARLAEHAEVAMHGFVDHTGLFMVADALEDRLTYDGLHLNAAGLELLRRVVLTGLAGPA